MNRKLRQMGTHQVQRHRHAVQRRLDRWHCLREQLIQHLQLRLQALHRRCVKAWHDVLDERREQPKPTLLIDTELQQQL